ncbi:Zinc finger A20 and AN1 domain-containing stress-associated protein 3 [Dichanthelium oligosanthes]|uniref:Zinc finger A20 and AN1 domain-containing stress-associated protein 3 n=1 Tax=Dichanthelium oligosanthes TaxID=888268 RepID=A0A1E5UWP6_9POAL|nr:Zinc finger A20 and AN1 domain-containing stress-associated protein 3 [Dichanthelium oligosanthes]
MSSFQQQQGSSRAAPPCAAECGFFGSPATLGMCSVCYKKHSPVNGAESATLIGTAGGVSFAPVAKATSAAVAEGPVVPSSSAPAAAKKVQPTRCAACYKKVGLTGFVCRCTKTFCGTHRYAEEHGCSFDFKGAGRDAIARNNPLVQGEKLSCKI